MRTLFTIILNIGILFSLSSQTPLKHIDNHPYVEPRPLEISKSLNAASNSGRLGGKWIPNTVGSIQSKDESVRSVKITASGSYWIEMNPNDLWAKRASISQVMEKIVPVQIQHTPWAMDWTVISEKSDDQNIDHIKIQQTLAGSPIHGQDMVLHMVHGNLRDLNGFVWTGKLPAKLPAPVPVNQALASAKSYLEGKNVVFQGKSQFDAIHIPEDEGHLVWFPMNGKLVLTYEVNMHPNTLDYWTLFVEATTLEVIEAYSQKCAFAPLQLFHSKSNEKAFSDKKELALPLDNAELSPCMDGPTSVSDQDLSGQNRTVNGYLIGTNYFMIDASKPGMFKSTQSVMPNEPVGVIWTVDGQNGSPQKANFEIVHITNTNNNWKNLEVSAHYNGGVAYEYFRQTFNRNSINGDGGNIISIINVRDENGNDMDNAYWNGSAMFYGNGNVEFNAPLAKALDVSGHELSHGVIQNTANLEYLAQSGALNESYADIFGAMIDRNDWQLGEDVSNPAVFPSGALRDLSNPNNGGTKLGDPGWQPKHMNEYQTLPNTPEGDNGGVHVNSGIPNKAFFLLATSVGKDKAEKIYYKALTDYLVKSSQFIDMRISAEKAATDLFGAGSAEVVAVRSAFDGVGIGSGQGGDYEGDIDVNGGADFILLTDDTESDLYWVPPGNPSGFVKLNVPAPISRPSFTDDGSACVYVDVDHNMIIINFDWTQGLVYQAFYLEGNPQGIWRNVVVSKDGTKIAYTTSNLRNEINVFDFNSSGNNVFVLFNPTTSTGGYNTGEVLYPDAMEWDYSGEYVMYDALNRIESTFGDGIDYWDISFLNAWDNAANSFPTGQIGKLFSGLPENISVGNPSFAKNSPYIITFDYLESLYDNNGQLQTDYRIKAANIEAGEVNDIYQNNTVGYPNYSKLDNKILFTYDNNGSYLLATIDIQAADKTLPVNGTDVILITGAQKGVWFTTGNRIFTSTSDANGNLNPIHLWPQPANEEMNVSGKGIEESSLYAVMDMTGRALIHGTLTADKTIQVERLIPGTYLLQITGKDGKVMNVRFVKQ